jgi:hypothetical protein
MNVQDWYIKVLEKKAAEEGVMLDYSTDNEAVANAEVKDNQGDQRSELTSLFSKAKGVEAADSKLIRKDFPKAKKTEGTMTSNPLMKVAMQQAYFGGLRETELLKMASLDFIKVAFQSFHDELEKIAVGLGWLDDAARVATKGLRRGGSKPLTSVKDLRPRGGVVKPSPAGIAAGSGARPMPKPPTSAAAKAAKTKDLTHRQMARFSNTPKQVGSGRAGVWALG